MSLPIIAIVGRPNVGKSTLFNRLAGRRTAIVSDVPGTTRDRVSIDAEWRDRKFIIVDTGGIEDKPALSSKGTPPLLWESVREQAKRALAEADGIILVVDAMTGIMPDDREAADLVRRTGKPSVIAVNKADVPAREAAVHEFHALGAGEPFPTSAYHGGGIDDLMLALLSELPVRDEEVESSSTPRVAIVGRPNVGKSAIYNSIIGSERAIVSPLPGTTRDSIDTRVDYQGQELTFIDTAGLRRRGQVGSEELEKYSGLRSLQSIQRCHVALLVMDCGEFPTLQDTHIGGFVDDANRAAVIIVNKWDFAREMHLTEEDAIATIRERFKFLPTAPVLFTCALTGRGVDKIPAKVLEVYEEFTRTLPPESVSRVLADAMAFRAPPSKPGRRVRISQATQTRIGPPTIVLRASHPELIHFSYRRYLENRFRAAFGFTGSPLKLEFMNEAG